MNNFLLLVVFGVLVIYFYGNMNLYKSLYRGIEKEKIILEGKIQHLEEIKNKLEKQVEFSLDTINDAQENLDKLRESYQELKLENTELISRNKQLQDRITELYASVGNVR